MKNLKKFCFSFALLFITSGICIASDYNEYFVKTDWLKKNINSGIVIVDARGKKPYKSGHIPGAVAVSWQELTNMTPEFAAKNWGTVTDKEILSDVISDLGIEKNSKVVIYSDTHNGWGEDGRIFWTFRVAGLKDLKILDGGISGWKNSGGELTKETILPKKSSFKVKKLNFKQYIDTDGLTKNYESFKIIDTRSESEFNGAVKFGEKRGGHLPGATLLPYKDFLKDGMLKPESDINILLSEKGIRTGDKVVTYCTAGVRSAYVQVVLEMLGYDYAQNYDESFYIWANRPDTYVGKVSKGKMYNYISAEQLNNKIKEREPVTIVDIQSHEDYQKHHVPGAIETNAYPVKTDDEKNRLAMLLPELKKDSTDIAVVCPRGGGGARRTIEFLKKEGVSASRLLILEKGQKGWRY